MGKVNTAVLLVDPYNDFLHESGKLTPRLRETLDSNDAINHMKKLVTTAREHGLTIFYCLHQQWTPGLYKGWQHMSSSSARQDSVHFFEEGTFRAQILPGLEMDKAAGDVMVSKHFNSK